MPPVNLTARPCYTPIWERCLDEARPRLIAAHNDTMQAAADTAAALGEWAPDE